MSEDQQDPQQRAQKEYARRVRAMQQEQQRREIARKLMDVPAYERLMNVRISNPELYTQLINLILQMAQSNRVVGKITDEQLRQILAKLTYKPEPTLSFKHK